MRHRRPLLAASALLTLAALAAAPPARAAAVSLRAALVDPKTIKLDGVPKEWPGAWARLSETVQGKVGKPDLDAQVLVAYDDARVYVAADVTDDRLRAGGDRIELALGFPGGTVHEVSLYPGEPGKTAGSVKMSGKAVQGAKLVEAPRSGGYTLEASIPWSAFAQAATVRVGLRAAAFAHDADASSSVEGVAGTASSPAYASLPSLSTEPEQALSENFIKPRGLKGAPSYNLIADVAGDALKERVLVYERFLIVLGPGFRKGTQFYFSDMEADAKAGMVPLCEARDLTGDGQAELLLRKRFGSGGRYREMLQVLQFGKGDTPTAIFQHEVALSTEKGSVINAVAFVPDGSKTAIRVTPGEAKGFHAGNYAEARETAFDPLLLPWGTIKSQLYKLSGAVFMKSAEEGQAPTAAPAAPEPAARSTPAAPPPPSSAQLSEQVYTQFKRDRGASGKPRFDFTADVTGGGEVERVLLHDRDLIFFGKGFKGGTGYAYLTLSQFAAGADIKDVGARDLTGDGKAELLVKGVLHANAPKEAGGGTVDRDVILVFQVQGEALKRVFAAEIGRAIGGKKIVGELKITGAGKGAAIELAPGRAVDWTEQTYPFNQDTAPVGGFEPLLLPWGGAKKVRYTWGGSGFSK